MLEYVDITNRQGKHLYGTLHNGEKKLILMAHGYFSSNRIGPHRLYYQIACTLQKHGYKVLRFDLTGIGESDGQLEDVVFQDHVSDLTDVIQGCLKKYDEDSIVLIAHCIGCNVSLPIINNNPHLFSKVIFVSPFFSTDATIDAFFDKSQQRELFTNGFTYRKGLYADATFFSGDNNLLPLSQTIKTHNNLISVIHAKEDQFISADEISSFYSLADIAPCVIPNADHNYFDRESRSDLVRTILLMLEE